MSAKKAKAKQSTKAAIIDALIQAYWAEMETVQNYIANSSNLDGVDAEPIKKALAADIMEEVGHAQQLANRIRVLGGEVPGSYKFKASQKSLQPPKDSTDVVSVIKGVIDAEEDGIAGYMRIIKLCDGVDYGTQDMCIALMTDEEDHRREFQGFLKQYAR
jgi:bacterioferritin